MTEPEFNAWIQESIPAYAQDQVTIGQWSQSEARELARREVKSLLALGLATPNHYLYTLRVENTVERIGTIWISVEERGGRPIAFVFDIEIVAEYRRRGHATRALIALEDTVCDLGLAGIALHVFGHNLPARKLYEKLGYGPTNITLFKPITSR